MQLYEWFRILTLYFTNYTITVWNMVICWNAAYVNLGSITISRSKMENISSTHRPFIWNKRNSRLIVFTQLFIEFFCHWNNWSNVNWWMDKSTQLHLKLERKKKFKLKKKIFQMNHLFIHIQNGAILIFMVFQKLIHIFSVLIWFLAQHPITLTDERILMMNIFQKKRIFNFSYKRRDCDFCQW